MTITTPRWPESSTALPPGTCLIHGPHSPDGPCPTCCTAVRITPVLGTSVPLGPFRSAL